MNNCICIQSINQYFITEGGGKSRVSFIPQSNSMFVVNFWKVFASAFWILNAICWPIGGGITRYYTALCLMQRSIIIKSKIFFLLVMSRLSLICVPWKPSSYNEVLVLPATPFWIIASEKFFGITMNPQMFPFFASRKASASFLNDIYKKRITFETLINRFHSWILLLMSYVPYPVSGWVITLKNYNSYSILSTLGWCDIPLNCTLHDWQLLTGG